MPHGACDVRPLRGWTPFPCSTLTPSSAEGHGAGEEFNLLRRSLKAKEGEYVPSSLGFMPAVVGSAAVLFTLAELAKYGIEVPWPWLWILLPLAIDPYCLPIVVLLLIRKLGGPR